MPEFSFSQGYIMDNIRLYLRQHGIEDKKVADGYCYALALLWSYKTLVGEQQQCYDLYKKIEQWNGEDDLEIEFEKLFSQLDWLQSVVAADHTFAGHSIDKINELEKDYPIREEFVTAFTYTEKEIIDLLEKVLKNEGKEVLIGSHNHEVSVVFKSKLFHFFDSNRGVTTFKSISDFVRDPEFGLIAAFTFENARLNKILNLFNIKKNIPKYFSLHIRALGLPTDELGHYPADPIEDIIQKRVSEKQSSGVDNKSWDDTTAVLMAAAINDVEGLKALVRNHAQINLKNVEGKTPLYKAVTLRNPDAVQFLLDHGADLSITYKLGERSGNILEVARVMQSDPLTISYLVAAAIKSNQIEILRSSLPDLITAGKVDFDLPMADGQSLMQIAIREANPQTVFDLLVMGAKIDVRHLGIADRREDEDIKTMIAGELLHNAIQERDTELFQELLNNYPNISSYVSANTKESPLIAALRTKQDAIALQLMTKENIDALSNENESPFIIALKNGCLESMKELMKHPFPLKDDEDNNLLHIAASAGQPAILTYLLENGFDKYLDKPNKEGITPIEKAVTGKNLEVVEILLNRNYIKPPKTHLQNTLAHHAARGSNQILQLVLDTNNATQPNFIGWTPIFYAIESGNLENVKLLAPLDKDNLSKKGQYRTPLNLAIKTRQVEVVHFLVENYGNDLINLANKEGQTPLHAVCEAYYFYESDQIEIAKLLIEHGASLTAKDKDGKSPFHYLGQYAGSAELAAVLLYAEPGGIIEKDKEGFTPLHYAAQTNNLPLVMFLLNNNAPLNTKNNAGKTPMDLATGEVREYFKFIQFCQDVKNFDLRAVEKTPNFPHFLKMNDFNGNTPLHLLIINGALSGLANKQDKQFIAMFDLLTKNPKIVDLNAKNKNGDSLLHTALKYGDVKTTEALLRHENMNVFIRNAQGENIMHVLINSPLSEYQQLSLVRLLINQAPALTYLKDKNNQTPLHHAVLAGNRAVAEALIYDPNINSQDAKGKTALHYAVEKQDMAMIELLIMRGAKIDIKDKAGISPKDLADKFDNRQFPTQIDEFSQKHSEQIQANHKFLDTVIKIINDAFPGNESQSRELKSSLEKISINKSEDAFQKKVIRFLEYEIENSNRKKSEKNLFSLFSKTSVANQATEYSKVITNVLSQINEISRPRSGLVT